MKSKGTKSGVKVGLNGNQPVQKTPGSKGVKSEAATQKVAKGRVGGTTKAPKKAEPSR
jgi:hypothetical protein